MILIRFTSFAFLCFCVIGSPTKTRLNFKFSCNQFCTSKTRIKEYKIITWKTYFIFALPSCVVLLLIYFCPLCADYTSYSSLVVGWFWLKCVFTTLCKFIIQKIIHSLKAPVIWIITLLLSYLSMKVYMRYRHYYETWYLDFRCTSVSRFETKKPS